MPIEVRADLRRLDHSEFHSLAYEIMGVIFEVHNEFSRLMDEAAFKTVIRKRCLRKGILCQREVEIRVSHGGFRKVYYLDFVFANALILEAKTVESINESHYAQVLNYLLLAGMNDGLLVNLRPERVLKRFISTQLNCEKRRQFHLDLSGYEGRNDSFSRCVEGLLRDWGTFLSVELYRDALISLNRSAPAAPRVAIFDDESQVGWYDASLLSPTTMLSVTALVKGQDEMEQQLRKLVRHTELKSVQWLNLDHHEVTLQTVA